jgi:hypothetical protein
LATIDGGWPDSIPPTTAVSGADDLWHNGDVSLALSAVDNPGGCGVDATYYQLGGGPWTEGTSLTISAPADHSNDGLHTVSYYSVDNAGNTEIAKSCIVKIDTTPPVISLACLSLSHHQHHSGWATHPSSPVRRHQKGWISWSRHGSRLSLSYRIDDNLSPTVDATIELMGQRGNVLQTVSLGPCSTGVLQVYRLAGKLPRGFRCLQVTATDLAGNTQSRLAGQRPLMRHQRCRLQ